LSASIALAKEWLPMHFCFYPKHDYGCPHVSHCPHLGGAALGMLVLAADEQTEWTDSLLRQVDALRTENTAKQLENNKSPVCMILGWSCYVKGV
jgi:hypothetical protein